MAHQPIRWGILATGNIAHKFALGLQTLPDATLQAVGSRSQASADAFGDTFDIPHRHASYEALVADPEVDIIYVATPHPGHHAEVLRCLEAGKHVLCEKPLALNQRQAAEMFALAEAKGLFLMEAMWTRFLPAWQQVQRWLAEGAIGEVQLLLADFCFRAGDWDPRNRKFAPELGGGALLDIGIYPIATAYLVLGQEPTQVHSVMTPFATGVDVQSAYVFHYENGAIAQLSSSFTTEGPREAIINGTAGRIRVPLFWRATEAILERPDAEPIVFDGSYPASGLQFQATAVMEALRQGWREHPLMPAAESLRILGMMDRLRASWGLRYPGE